MLPRPLALVLLLANLVVLLGQVWPEGAPPFARPVNIGVLSLDVLLLGFVALRPRRR